MPINPGASIEVTAFRWVPEGAQGLVKDLRVRWALEEAGLDYRVRLIGPDRPPGYVDEQAYNQVPCLRDETLQIFESGAIVQYIAEKSEALLPSDPQGRYRAIQWAFAAVNSVEPFVQLRTLLDVVFAGEEWSKLSKPTIDHYAKLRLQQTSDRLAEQQWLEGQHFSMGDLMMITVLRIADRGGLLTGFPNLVAYVRRGEDRPAFQRALRDQLSAFAQHQPEPEGEAA